MEFERRALGVWAEDPRVLIRLSAARSVQARRAANEMVKDGARFLLSFGIAGGLDPNLRSGTFCRVSEVWTEDEIKRSAISVANGRAIGVDQIARTRYEKQTLRAKTGADFVDMESHIVADVAVRNGLPFAVFRAISDEAGTRLPIGVDDVLASSGSPSLPAVFAQIVRRPWELPLWVRAGKDSRRALAALKAAVDHELPPLIVLSENAR